jgi:hypothetical protein
VIIFAGVADDEMVMEIEKVRLSNNKLFQLILLFAGDKL